MSYLAKTLLASAAVVTFGMVPSFGAITVTGSLADGVTDFGTPLATQTIQTGFGKSTDPSGASTGGSELDDAYGAIENGNLYLLLTGNIEAGTAANHINIYIADGRAGQSTLNVAAGTTLANSNGSTFSPNFGSGATYVVDSNDYSGTLYTDAYDLVGNTNSYLGSAVPDGGAPTVLSNGISIALNNTNVLGQPVVNTPGAAVTTAQDLTATTGLEVAIPLSLLGNPTGSIEVLALINGGGDGYLSNQLLPGLAVGTGNLGNPNGVADFNFGSTPGEFFTVGAVPEPASLSLIGGVALLATRRRRQA